MAKGNHLGDLEELVLLSVLRLKDEAYGARIRAQLIESADRSVSISTIYVTLMRLEEKGYVRSWMGEPSGVRGGKAKRFFGLSPEGVEALQVTRNVREQMWEGVEASLDADARVG